MELDKPKRKRRTKAQILADGIKPKSVKAENSRDHAVKSRLLSKDSGAADQFLRKF